jgi:ABC-type multidrug transport system fused ATPase/permease subunit
MAPPTEDLAVLAIVGALSVPHLVCLCRRLSPRHRPSPTLRAWYSDDDGDGTPETIGAFDAALRRAQFVVIGVAVAGAVIAGAMELSGHPEASPIHDDSDWTRRLRLGVWAAFVLQAAAIWTCWIGASKLGVVSTLSALPAVSVSLVRLAVVASAGGDENGSLARRGYAVALALHLGQFLAAVAFAFAGIAIPRKPRTIDPQGHPVDPVYAVSILTQITFGTLGELIRKGKRKGDLGGEDLPQPDVGSRASALAASWRDFGPRTPLWLALLRNWPGTFFLEQVTTVLRGLVGMGPSLCVLQLLRLVEDGRRDGAEAKLWALGLFASMVLDDWSAVVFWQFIWNRIYVPIRSQLAGLVFAKALRAKDVKSVSQGDAKEDGDRKKKKRGADDDDDGDSTGSRAKNLANMVSVDVDRVATFCITNIDLAVYPFVDFAVTFGLLASILGWRPLGVCAAVMAVFTWFNVANIRRYGRAQAAVMAARDAKMEIVREAIAGIRQIKFSATEGAWEGLVNDARRRELGDMWAAIVATIVMTASVAAIPAVLAIVAFAAYGYFEGPLKPSVAFATLAVFGRFKNTLTLLPVSGRGREKKSEEECPWKNVGWIADRSTAWHCI